MSDNPDVERRLMDLLPGFEIQLVAFEPDVVNPIQMNFDAQGRLWVICAPRYPQLLPGQEPADYVLVLDDFAANGKARSARVFATGLMIPTGLAPGDGGVYVGQADSLLHFRETKGTGKADQKRVVLAGFGTQDTHHTLNTFRWGPDGALYFNQGIYVKSTVETPFGPRQLFGGCVWRLRTDRLGLEVFDRSILDNNTWGHVFDAWGQSFVASAWPADINRVLPDSPLQQGADRALIPPLKLTRIGGGRHCGMEIISGRHFPEDWQGDLLTGDFLTHRVQRYRLKDDGHNFSATPLAPLVVSRHRKFRPIDIKMGPDGAIYVADLYQQIIQHNQIDFRDPRRDHKHGRIWRIVRKDRPLLPVPKLVGVSAAQVLAHLKDPEQWTRLEAKRSLAERDHKEVAAALAAWVPTLDRQDANTQRDLLEALWTYQAIDEVNVPLLTRLLHSDDFRVRAAATRVLGAWSDRVPGSVPLLATQAADPQPRVRLEAVLAASRIPSSAAVDAALRALDEPADALLDFAMRKTVLLLKPYWYPEFQQGKFTFAGRVKPLTFALEAIRAPDALPTLADLLKKGKVPRENRIHVLSLLASLGNSQQQALAFEQALASFLPVTERTRILEALRQSAQTRSVRPATDLLPLAGFFDNDDVPLSAAALRLAGAWKLEKLRPGLLDIASAPTTPGVKRQAAIAALVDLGGAATVQQLQTLAAADKPYPVRMEALIGMASADVARAARLTAPLLKQPVGPNQDLTGVFTAFLQRAGGAAALSAVLKDSAPSADAAKIGVRAINSLGVQAGDLLGVLQAASGEAGKTRKLDAKELRRLIDLVQAQGNSARGEQVFRRPALGCMRCHAIAGAGPRVGPDLATIGTSAPLDYLVESVLLPGKVVKEGYTMATVVTKTGRAISGIVLRETPRELVLREPTQDQELVIPIADIDERQNGGSLMPNGLDYTLTDAELADLVRFLSELGRPGPYALSHVPVARRWQYLASLPDSLVVLDDAALGKALRNDQLNWTTAYSLVSGHLPLSDVTHQKRGQAVVRCQLEVSTAGKVLLTVNGADGLKLWVDGAMAPVTQHVALHLARGMHSLDLYVDMSRRKQASLRCELTVPNGSQAQAAFVAGR